MSSKVKEKLRLVADRNKQIAQENQRLKRLLIAMMYEFGELHVSYQSACKVQDDDQLEISFDKKSGLYSCRLVGDKNAERMGIGSEEVGVSGGEGDVGGPISSEEDVLESAGEEVRTLDQQHPREDLLVRDSEEVKRGSE